MRLFLCVLSILVAIASTAGVALYLGHSRALGHEEWRFEARLIRAYANEIPIHAGPIWVLAMSSCVAAFCSPRAAFTAFASTVLASGLVIFTARDSVRAYIVAPPGSLMHMPSECVVVLWLLWLGSLCVLSARRSR
jgi:hypothetical protein